jgi:hypothetical protein
MVLDGAINQEAFAASIAQSVLPSLVPGQIVILANLAVHSSPWARQPERGGKKLSSRGTRDLGSMPRTYAVK